MIQTAHNTFMFGDGAVFIACASAGRCPCGRASFLFINRNGKTLCLICDGRRFDVAASEQDGGDDPSAEQSFMRAIV